jgi:hypothetical protein
MAPVIIKIQMLDTPTLPDWKRVSAEKKAALTALFNFCTLKEVCTFKLQSDDDTEVLAGYAHTSTIAERLSLEVVIEQRGSFKRFTMQRMNAHSPFIQLI